MQILPSSFISMINNAESVQAVEHIFSCVDDLYGFEYSPDDGGDNEWKLLISARDKRIEDLS